jgi:hypothetical protein
MEKSGQCDRRQKKTQENVGPREAARRQSSIPIKNRKLTFPKETRFKDPAISITTTFL